MKLEKALEAIRRELKAPLPEPRVPPKPVKKRKRKMAKKTNSDEATEKPSKKKGKKVAKGEAKKVSKKKAKSSDEKSNGDVVTLKQLAAEAEISPQAARAKLRNADLKRPEGSRWGWEKGSKELAKVRDAIGL